jgi:hypothetical protein
MSFGVSVGYTRLLCSSPRAALGNDPGSDSKLEQLPGPSLLGVLVEDAGLEPVTSCVQGRRSPN